MLSTFWFKEKSKGKMKDLEGASKTPHGLLFTYNFKEKEYRSKPLIFKNFDEKEEDSFFSPKFIFSSTFRRNSKVQNEMKKVQKLLEVRLFLYTFGIQDFSRCISIVI